MPRRPAEDRWAVISWYKEGLTTAEICRKTGFYKQFVTHWISKYKDSGSVDDAPACWAAEEAFGACGAGCREKDEGETTPLESSN